MVTHHTLTRLQMSYLLLQEDQRGFKEMKLREKLFEKRGVSNVKLRNKKPNWLIVK